MKDMPIHEILDVAELWINEEIVWGVWTCRIKMCAYVRAPVMGFQ